jgi:hypothetical protein
MNKYLLASLLILVSCSSSPKVNSLEYDGDQVWVNKETFQILVKGRIIEKTSPYTIRRAESCFIAEENLQKRLAELFPGELLSNSDFRIVERVYDEQHLCTLVVHLYNRKMTKNDSIG